MAVTLPCGITVFERGWLSSNNILIQGAHSTALIDSGYCTHAEQTRALLQSALGGRPLDLLVNTHLHSDHCGGNAALQAAYPLLQTRIPPGQAEHVQTWNAYALSYTPTGQSCPQFRFDATLQPGTDMLLGDMVWQVHAAPGHDPHSVILFEPASRTLVSADALWEHGFGVVFPELDGLQAFNEVAKTLDLIERLNPATIIPGHGSPFTDSTTAISAARRRLGGFVSNPAKHRHYAAKVLLKFKLLEAQVMKREAILQWATETPYFVSLLGTLGDPAAIRNALCSLEQELIRSGAANGDSDSVYNN